MKDFFRTHLPIMNDIKAQEISRIPASSGLFQLRPIINGFCSYHEEVWY